MAEIVVTFKDGTTRKWSGQDGRTSSFFTSQVRAEPGFVIIDDGTGLRTWIPANDIKEISEDCRVRRL